MGRHARRAAWQTSSTTGNGSEARQFRVVHPFHPWVGRTFELLGYAHTWGERRVFFRVEGQTCVRSLPASWTDVEGPDPFLVLAAGRSLFRVEDLIALAVLLRELDAGGCQ
ncbi:MAG: hypothetical protein HYX53_03375 [Chloroflexi bacterium]|nr:hypothetical protein [Chloroflexota bacterium]